MKFARESITLLVTLLVPLTAMFALPSPAVGQDTAQARPVARLDQPIPIDPQVLIGQLPNGLRYYIRENRKPEQRAELRLVVNAGSVLEDSTQRGLAHLLEHMAFNGTKHYAKQELVNYLESTGVRFGADLNAYTSFDETVYMLTVPTDSARLLEKGIEILGDWAHDVTLDSAQVDRERGVVIEEWRLGRGAASRMRDKQLPILFQNSRYATRLPIGDKHTLETFSRAELKRFYTDWYRPDLMAVVAVGDFDKARVEQLIRERFSGIPAPANPRPRTVYPVPDHDQPLVAIATDPEATRSTVSVYYKQPLRSERTIADYRRGLVEALYNGMLNDRLEELTQRANPPFLGASSSQGRLTRSKEVYTLSAAVPDNGLERGLEAMLTEAERVAQHGFTRTELERQKRDLLRGIEQAYAERAKTNSAVYVSDYIDNFLDGDPIPSLEQEYELSRQLVPGIQLDEVNRLAREWINGRSRVILANAPQKQGVKVPDAGALLAVFDSVDRSTVTAYSDTVSDTPLVPRPPKPGRVVSERRIASVGVTEWTLANGLRVLLKPTDFKDDEIVFRGYSPGGTSLSPDQEIVPASTASAVVSVGGVGEFNAIALQKALAGKSVRVGSSIGPLEEEISGRASPQDIETLFQLTYLHFTAPRADSAAFRSYQARVQAALADRSASPMAAFQDTVQVTLAQHHVRARPLTSEMFDQMNLEKSLTFYRDRFADASDFTFIFVGNLDLQTLKPLVETYLGGLPSRRRKESWRDVGIDYPRGVIRRTVRRGVEPRSQTELDFSGPFEFTRQNVQLLNALTEVLEIRLRERLREDLGGTYSVSVAASPQHYPRPRYDVAVSFGSAPERADELTKAVFAEIDSLKAHGPSRVDVNKVRETLLRERETNLRRNEYWLSLLYSYNYNHWDPKGILDYSEEIRRLDPEAIKDAARRYLDEKNYVQVTLLPEK
jgi:zinc protease